jgi:hypothetical protein
MFFIFANSRSHFSKPVFRETETGRVLKRPVLSDVITSRDGLLRICSESIAPAEDTLSDRSIHSNQDLMY